MTAPAIVQRGLHHLGTYRVQANISNQALKISRAVNQDRLEPTLKKVPNSLGAPVVVASVPERHVLEDLRKRHRIDLHCKMDMVSHETKRENTMSVTLHTLLEQ